MRTKTVGSGLLPKPTINYTYLGIDREEAKKLERIIKINSMLGLYLQIQMQRECLLL